MNNMANGNKMLSIEEFEQKLRQQKDPMKISLTNPMVNFENQPGMGPVSPMSPMNQNMDYNQMKKKKEYYQSSLANHGLKSKSSNSSLNGSNSNLYRMNSDQTLLQSPKFNPHPPLNGMGSMGSMDNLSIPGNKFLNANGSDLTIDTNMHNFDNNSYEFTGTPPIGNPMMGSKLMMNPAFNSSQSSFNSYGGAGFRDESFDDDSDLDDFLDGPKRKPTETEALADFLKNTGPDMLGGPQSPIDSPELKRSVDLSLNLVKKIKRRKRSLLL